MSCDKRSVHNENRTIPAPKRPTSMPALSNTRSGSHVPTSYATEACQNLNYTRTASSWVRGSRISLKSTTNMTPTAFNFSGVMGR